MIVLPECPCPCCRACIATGRVWASTRLFTGQAWRFLNTPVPHTCIIPVRADFGPQRPVRTVARYLVSSWFLKECFDYLTLSPDESLHYVTGVQDNGTYHLSKMITFDMARQSVGGASGDMRATHNAAVEADRYGHAVSGLFHSHPGHGASATQPSATDHETHEAYERGGYPLIGAIFSRDAHVRFFGHARRFQVEVFGKRVKEVSKDVYKLALDEELSVSDGESGGTG